VIYFSRRHRAPEDALQLKRRDIPFVNNVKCLSVTSCMRMTWRILFERTAVKTLGTYIRTYSLFKAEHLSIHIKLNIYKIIGRSGLVDACPIWQNMADPHLLKVQHLQDRVLRALGVLDRGTPVRDLKVALRIPYLYDYIILLCKKQTEPSKKIYFQMYIQLDKEKSCIASIRG
jgi:hypothetical protein